MEELKAMKKCLMSQVQSQMGHLDQVDAKELGEAIDMIKDLEEAIYYKTITEAMTEKEKYSGMMPQESHYNYYSYYPMYENGRMYATNGNSSSSSNGNTSYGMNYYEEYPMMRDPREGRSPINRRMYMESKHLHHDKSMQMQELDKYLKELSSDITEMIQDASMEEKELLKNKLTTLASKVGH